MGDHVSAARAIRRSVKACLSSSGSSAPGIDFVAASANEILCEMASHAKLSKKKAAGYEKKLHELEAIAAKQGEYWGGPWALNCAVHRLQVCIRAEGRHQSWAALETVRRIYMRWSVKTGWDAGGYPTIALLDGLVHVLFPRTDADLKHGVGLLARAFMLRIGSRQRPEGIRDAGFGLAIGLQKSLGEVHSLVAAQILNVMRQTRDGTSVLWPWRLAKYGGGLEPKIA